MSDSSFDALYSGMDDVLGSMPEAAPTEEAAPTPVAEEATAEPTPAPEQPEQAPEAEPQPGEESHNPEGPGDTAKAFQAYRAEIAAYKAQLAEAQQAAQEAAQYRDYFAKLQAQQQEAQLAQQLEQYADDPDAIAQILQAQQREIAQQYEQRIAAERVNFSKQAAIAAAGGVEQYNAAVEKVYGVLGTEVADGLAFQQSDPAGWMVSLAQSLRTDAEVEALVESRVQARLAELAPRTQPKTPIASRGIGQLPAAAPNTNEHPASESFRALNFGPGSASFDAAYTNLLGAAGG